MSRVLRASYRVPAQAADLAIRRVHEMFAEELVKALHEGGILGPIHEDSRTYGDDPVWPQIGPVFEFTMYAHFTELPQPEEYRFMGGPADGRIVRTGGARTYRIPYLPPVSVTPFDLNADPVPRYAEYERQGDTQVYLFRRIGE